MVTLFNAPIFGIPPQANTIRDWIVWSAAIVGGLVASGVGLYKIATWARATAANGVKDLLQPEFDGINAKIDALKEGNEAQHAEVAVQLHEMRADLQAHRVELTEHLAESALATELLQQVTDAVNTHVTALRDEITNPGLPVTPGPLTPGTPRQRYMF